jgi:hypothetical protein
LAGSRKIAPDDIWSEEISRALNTAKLFILIVSMNYITSHWCKLELSKMASRIKKLGPPAGQPSVDPPGELPRIFRVDKHKVREDKVPKLLRGIQSVRFYREDYATDSVDEYFWRGKVRFTREYEEAVHALGLAIYKQIVGAQPQPPPDSGRLVTFWNGRVVFVAKPASDMVESYRTLVSELQGLGYRVTPDPDTDLGKVGEDVVSTVVRALGEAEASIHLLGTRTGGRPDGLDMDLVPMKHAAAADEANRKPGFERMIWVPAVLPAGAPRDPLSVVDRFGKMLPTDQINSDTAVFFNEFVLQRLGGIGLGFGSIS